MKYLPEKTEDISTLKISNSLTLFDLSDNEEKLKIDNILPGKYKVIRSIVQEDRDEEGCSIYAHAFILHELISTKDLNEHIWNRKNQISFDTSIDEAYMGLFTSKIGIEQFNKQNPTFEEAISNSEMIQTFESGIAFSFPFADYGNKIEYIKLEENIVGFRIQGIGKEFDLEHVKNHKKKPKI